MKKLIVLVLACIFAVPARATSLGLAEYYIGVDSAPAVTFGDYTGLPNPNQHRLTFLFNHGDHFHGIGRFDYTGPVDDPKVVPTNANNRIPEIFTGLPPLPLTPGVGSLYGDKLVSNPSEAEYSQLETRSVQSLRRAPPGSEANILYTSSNGRWTISFGRAVVAMQLVSKTERLHIGTESELHVLEHPGDFVILGRGHTLRFTPVFWTEGDAPSGTYSAEFRLLDINTREGYKRVLHSGTFNFDFTTVP